MCGALSLGFTIPPGPPLGASLLSAHVWSAIARLHDSAWATLGASLLSAHTVATSGPASRATRGTVAGSVSSSRRRAQATTHHRRTAVRTRTAVSKAHCGSPPNPKYSPKKENRVTNTARSAISNATKAESDVAPSANQGSSHSPYCGEYTLFDRRNVTRSGNPSIHRGKSGSALVFTTQITPNESAKSAADSRLMRPTLPQTASIETCRQPMNQRLSQSAPRAELKRKNSDHDDGEVTAKGRLTRAQAAPADQPRRIAPSGSRCRIMAPISGTTR